MRYTRYNYKPPRKNSSNFMVIFILTIIAAIVIGTLFSKVLLKDTSGNSVSDDKTKQDIKEKVQPSKDDTDASQVSTDTNNSNYVVIQCGAFGNMEKALDLKNSLMEFGTPFIVEEDKLNKVLFGIYPTDGIDSITKLLTENKIDYFKIKLELIAKDSTSAQTNEMISAHIRILNKLSEKDTGGYETVELKKWLLTLNGAEEKSENYKDMTVIKTYLTALPAEFKKEKTEEGYIYIYKFIKKLLTI
ncbi:MAG: SPOR domain-containing protein [Clostridium sp.]